MKLFPIILFLSLVTLFADRFPPVLMVSSKAPAGGGGGGGGITFHNVSNERLVPSASGSETTSHTLNSTLANGYIVVAVAWFDGSATTTISGITFDGTPMTLLTNMSTNAFGGAYKAFLYGLAVGSKASGTYDAVVTFSSAVTIDEYSCMITSREGVHQTTSYGAGNIAIGNDTTPTVDVSSASGELVVDCVTFGGTPGAVGGGQTSRHADVASTGGGTSDEPGGATVTMSWSQGSARWVEIAMPLKPAP